MSRHQCLLKHGRVTVWVGTLGINYLRPAVLTSKLTVAVNHLVFSFWWMISLYSWNTCFFNNITCGSCMMGQHLTFSPQSHTAKKPDFRWTMDRVWKPCKFFCNIPWLWSLRIFSDDQWLRGITQRAENNCQEILMKARIFLHNTSLCSTYSWKLCWNA